MSRQVPSILAAKSKAQMRDIMTACESHIELQAVVLDVIQKYTAMPRDMHRVASVLRRQKATTVGTLGAASPRAAFGAVRPELPAEDDELGVRCYARMTRRMLQDILMFVEANLLVGAIHNLDKTQLLELIEYAFGIRCIGTIIDKTPTTRKRELYMKLAELCVT
jgi:hypothetical protein